MVRTWALYLYKIVCTSYNLCPVRHCLKFIEISIHFTSYFRLHFVY